MRERQSRVESVDESSRKSLEILEKERERESIDKELLLILTRNGSSPLTISTFGSPLSERRKLSRIYCTRKGPLPRA